MRIYEHNLIPDSVALLKGISDTTRLRIMALLVRTGELCVCQIQGALGESQYKISRHLKILRHAGWVEEQRRGRWVYYVTSAQPSNFHKKVLLALRDLPPGSLDLAVGLDRIDTLKKQTSCQR